MKVEPRRAMQARNSTAIPFGNRTNPLWVISERTAKRRYRKSGARAVHFGGAVPGMPTPIAASDTPTRHTAMNGKSRQDRSRRLMWFPALQIGRAHVLNSQSLRHL